MAYPFATFVLTIIGVSLSSRKVRGGIGLHIGSDCAFFIKNKPVYAFNKGDEFEEFEIDLSNYNIKVEFPDVHVGTAEAYSGVVPQKSEKI